MINALIVDTRPPMQLFYLFPGLLSTPTPGRATVMQTSFHSNQRGLVFLGLALSAICVSGDVSRGADDRLPPPATTMDPANQEVIRWESEIRNLEALDRKSQDPVDAVLFLGSSSIRLWDSIDEDMTPYPTIRRGYGGARYRDLRHFVARLVAAHQPRAIVIFVANDITSPEISPDPEQVMIDIRATQAKIRERLPEVPIFYVAITPTESRWSAWPTVQRLNGMIEEMCRESSTTFFIPTARHFLDPTSGRPVPNLFRVDHLHLSPAGYKVWADVIRSSLDEVLTAPTAVPARADRTKPDCESHGVWPATISRWPENWAAADGGRSRGGQEFRRVRLHRRLQPLHDRSCRYR